MDGRLCRISSPASTCPRRCLSEGAFAASNTCLALSGADIFFGTGAGRRVFHSSDSGAHLERRGNTHRPARPPLDLLHRSRDKKTIIVAGAIIWTQARVRGCCVFSRRRQDLATLHEQPGGYRSLWLTLMTGRWVAAGPNGEDLSGDFGAHWKTRIR